MAKPSTQLKVLYAEGNEQVLTNHSVTIQQAGHLVEKALGRKAAEEALRRGPFDLVVLGPTLTKNDRHHLPYMVKKANEQTQVLVMHSDGDRHPRVDLCLETGRNSVDDLLAAIASRFAKPLAAAAGR